MWLESDIIWNIYVIGFQNVLVKNIFHETHFLFYYSVVCLLSVLWPNKSLLNFYICILFTIHIHLHPKKVHILPIDSELSELRIHVARVLEKKKQKGVDLHNNKV